MRSLLGVSILGLTIGIGLSEACEGLLAAVVGILLAGLLLVPEQGMGCGHRHPDRPGMPKFRSLWILMIAHHIFDGVLLGTAVMTHELLIALPVLFHEVPKSIALVEHFCNQGLIPRDAWRRVAGLVLWCIPGALLGCYYGSSVQKLAMHLHPLGGGLAISIASLGLYRRLQGVRGSHLRVYVVVALMATALGLSIMHRFHHELPL